MATNSIPIPLGHMRPVPAGTNTLNPAATATASTSTTSIISAGATATTTPNSTTALIPAPSTLIPTPTTNPSLATASATSSNTAPTSYQSAPAAVTISPNSTPTSAMLANSRIGSIFSYWIKPGLALLFYALTLYVASTASTRRTVLGSVNASTGNWFLTLLAKAGDITFAFAVEDAFDTLTWRMLKKRKRTSGRHSFGGMKLYWFLALVSSTGVEGLVKIIFKSFRKQTTKRAAGIRWSFVRLAFIIALIPGPGIILMSKVPQSDVYFPIRTMDVSGGLAVYDPRIATLAAVWKPEISKLVQFMLRDRSVTMEIDPISNACKKSKSCMSYLIAGPYMTVAPWPFTVEDDSVDGFRLENAPFYQVELWDTWDTNHDLVFNPPTDCTIYGGLDAISEYSTLFCLTEQTPEGLLAAGWMSCQEGYAPNGTCLSPAQAEGNKASWSTYIQFYRRKATITFSRSDFTIKEVYSLSPAIPQQISPSSLFESLNTILYQPNQTTNDIRYDKRSQQYALTQHIGSNLWYSLHTNLNGVSFAKDWLRNFLVMPVYIFQPTILAIDAQTPILKGNDNGTLEQPNLPDENYIKGSYCVVSNRAVPDWRTVVGYGVAALLVLIFVIAVKAIAWAWEDIETSDFGMLDYELLTELIDEQPNNTVSLRDKMIGRSHGSGSLLDAAADLRVGLRNVC